jgi:pteridine reductase
MIESLLGRTILVTGAARRLGKSMAVACAKSGADVILHYGNSGKDVKETEEQIRNLGRKTWCIQADLGNPDDVDNLCKESFERIHADALVNNAAIFKPVNFENSTLADWNLHIQVNLTAPFLLSQAFAANLPEDHQGRIVNIIDWRALRPGRDHFPYTISKAALASMTKSTALALAPNISVNAIALGAILPPENEPIDTGILNNVPLKRWANLEELDELLVFLLSGPMYITGEIIHLDGGRHLV